jgi:hypothetical protein
VSHFRFAGSSDLLIEITQPFWLAKCWAKFLIKENQRITHNSIFADFAHFGFHTSRVPFEIRNQTVKDPSFFSSVHGKTHSQQSSINHRLRRIGSTLSQEQLQPHTWKAGPLIAGHIKYTSLPWRQSESTCFSQILSSSPPLARRSRERRRLPDLQSSPQMNTDFHRCSEKAALENLRPFAELPFHHT